MKKYYWQIRFLSDTQGNYYIDDQDKMGIKIIVLTGNLFLNNNRLTAGTILDLTSDLHIDTTTYTLRNEPGDQAIIFVKKIV